jgi:hypothetical protein
VGIGVSDARGGVRPLRVRPGLCLPKRKGRSRIPLWLGPQGRLLGPRKGPLFCVGGGGGDRREGSPMMLGVWQEGM